MPGFHRSPPEVPADIGVLFMVIDCNIKLMVWHDLIYIKASGLGREGSRYGIE
jgi:hypothetical protein